MPFGQPLVEVRMADMTTDESRPDYVRDISTLRITDADDAGGKGANLGELVAAELPVPPGFVLMRACYLDTT